MPTGEQDFSTTLIQKEWGEYGPFIGAPITFFGIGVREIRLSISVNEEGDPSAFELKVNKLLVPDTNCKGLSLDE